MFRPALPKRAERRHCERRRVDPLRRVGVREVRVAHDVRAVAGAKTLDRLPRVRIVKLAR